MRAIASSVAGSMTSRVAGFDRIDPAAVDVELKTLLHEILLPRGRRMLGRS